MSLPRSARGTRHDLILSTIDGVACSVMVGCGETSLPAFAVAVGLGPVAAGLIATVPMLVGATLQLLAPPIVARIGSNRRWVACCTALQAASYAPLVWWAIRGHAEFWEIFVAASLYWSAGMASLAAWTVWIGTLVPPRVRTSFFTQRSRLCLVGIIAGLGFGWLVFRVAEGFGGGTGTFAVLFAVAGIARLISAGCMSGSSERGFGKACHEVACEASAVAPPNSFLKLRGIIQRPSAWLMAYLACFAFGSQFAVPYFTPYLLEASGVSYSLYVAVTAMGFVARLAFLPTIGRLASRHGPPRLLQTASLALLPIPLFWLVSTNAFYLGGVQFIAGSCWAAHELAVMLLMFEAVRDRERMAVTTLNAWLVAVATAAGAACGGLLLQVCGETLHAYAAVFAVSALLRLACLPLLRGIGGGNEAKHALPGRR
jgi:MFS family permease